MQPQKADQRLGNYRIIKYLGEGHHSQVYLAQDQQGRRVAIKKYNNNANQQTIQNEAHIISSFDSVWYEQERSKNIIKLYQVLENTIYTYENGFQEECSALVLQYAQGGELFEYIYQTGRFTEVVARTFFNEIMTGVSTIHSRGYAHRDLKPANVLFDANFVLKISDFGFSIALAGRNNDFKLRSKLGSLQYMAPQIFKERHYQGKSVDIFAAGVMLFMMIAGQPPFDQAKQNDRHFRLLIDERYDDYWMQFQGRRTRRRQPIFSDDFKDLFIRMTKSDPKQRIQIQQIGQHPFVLGQLTSQQAIFAQFTQRKAEVERKLEQERLRKQAERTNRNQAVRNQGQSSVNRCRVDPQLQNFCQIYNDQLYTERNLSTLKVTDRDDAVIKEAPVFVVALLKQKLKQIQLHLIEFDQQDEDYDPENYFLQFKQMKDEGKDKINVIYQYKYFFEEQEIQQQLQIQIQVGVTSNKQTILKFEHVGGSSFDYRKVLGEIKLKCLL